MNKKLLMFLCGAVWLALASCQDDDVDLERGLNFAPTVVSVYPRSTVRVGTDFPVKVHLVDGTSSPLASATLILKDESGKEVFNITRAISGTKDSVVIAAADFNAAGLPLGTYTLSVSAKDTRDNVNAVTSTFKIADQLYAANQKEMYVAGEFNGWGAGVMELVADNTWEIKNINLAGGAWKLKNTVDWTDKDWGDDNCDKTMVAGNGDIKCGYSGEINLRFNDETLVYTITPVSTYRKNVASLFLLGTLNSFEGEVPEFKLIGHHTWEIGEVLLPDTAKFRFSERKGFGGKVFGLSDTVGYARREATRNIPMPAGSVKNAYYKLTFNDSTRKYDFTFLRLPPPKYPDALYLVGGSTSAGWTPADAIPFRKVSGGVYEIYAYLDAAGGGFKFLEVKDWAGDWGKSKTADGTLEQDNEDNVTVASSGFYYIHVDFNMRTYTTTATTWSIIGAALTGNDTGWSTDADMTYDGPGTYTWTLTQALKVGEFKFRANHAWDLNYGDTGGDFTLDYNSNVNIKITADGTYTIVMKLDPVNGYTYTVSPI